jgi:hypothetical protein
MPSLSNCASFVFSFATRSNRPRVSTAQLHDAGVTVFSLVRQGMVCPGNSRCRGLPGFIATPLMRMDFEHVNIPALEYDLTVNAFAYAPGSTP